MKAGRELDALIAERVMGFHKHHLHGYLHNAPSDEVWDAADLASFEYDYFWPSEEPHYSTDIADAWEVVPVLDQRLDQFWSVVRVGEKFEFYANSYELGDYSAYVEADTLPLLLCLAALKAKGETGEQHG